MSNFICNDINTIKIDLEEHKTDREIELEKKLKLAEENAERWRAVAQQHIIEADKLKTACASAASFLTCMEDLSKHYGKCNEQMALEALNEVLSNEKQVFMPKAVFALFDYNGALIAKYDDDLTSKSLMAIASKLSDEASKLNGNEKIKE